MKTLKNHITNQMLNICECDECHGQEYYGMFHWHNGKQYCRKCIYEIWQDEEWREKKRLEEQAADRENRKPLYDRIPVWRPTEKDYMFPIYSDGINYNERENEYE